MRCFANSTKLNRNAALRWNAKKGWKQTKTDPFQTMHLRIMSRDCHPTQMCRSTSRVTRRVQVATSQRSARANHTIIALCRRHKPPPAGKKSSQCVCNYLIYLGTRASIGRSKISCLPPLYGGNIIVDSTGVTIKDGGITKE